MPAATYDVTVARMQAFIRFQYRANRAVTLAQIRDHCTGPYRVHPDLARFVYQDREAIRAVLVDERRRRVWRQFSLGLRNHIQRDNQFLSLRPEDHTRMELLYDAYLDDLAAIVERPRDLAEVSRLLHVSIRDHLRALHAFVVALDAANRHGEASLLDRPVVCEEYPPRLQMAVLGLDPARLREPILDVGCGHNGALVSALRDLGLKAFGLDRLVDAERPGLQEADWLTFPYGVNRWGAVISHLGFSHHFAFHHRYRYGSPTIYAQVYMTILGSIRAGGAFYYAPSLPFIEDLLPPDVYAVQRRPVPVPGVSTVDGEPAQAVRVVRLR